MTGTREVACAVAASPAARQDHGVFLKTGAPGVHPERSRGNGVGGSGITVTGQPLVILGEPGGDADLAMRGARALEDPEVDRQTGHSAQLCPSLTVSGASADPRGLLF